MSDRPLTILDVTRTFEGMCALDGVTLEVHRHEFLAIVGPSGCGKTTLLNLASGHDRPSSGCVARHGEARMIFQQDGLFPWASVADNIALGLRHLKDANARRAQLQDLLTLIRLERFADHFPHQLSGGMRQLVELARALAGDAPILLMDEPFSSLDYLTRLRMRQELTRMLEERPRTVMFVTHDIEEAVQLADRVLVLTERPGRVRAELRVDLPRLRRPADPDVGRIVRRALAEMGLEGGVALHGGRSSKAGASVRGERP